MVDVAVLVRKFLLAQDAVTLALQNGGSINGNANGAIYAAADLPEHFDPTLGPGIQLARSGGIPEAEILPLVTARLLVKIWDDQEQYQRASDLYGAVRDALHGSTNVELDEGMMLSALAASEPQEMSDPVTGWVCVYAFYSVMARPVS